ncbi:MAG: sulfatase [Actinomycetota bacterium]|nr:sulfatase [Actinomycetota bacterium]
MTIDRGDGPFRVRRRMSFGALAFLAVLLLFVASYSGSATSFGKPQESSETSQEEEALSAADRPNMIFVLTDDLDYAIAEKMPELRSLMVEEGVSFENAFTSQSLCCPSRATSLNGLYAHNHQIKGNKPPDGGFEKFRDEGHEEDTIATRLQEEGYQTAFIGKYLNGYPAGNPTHVPPGWDEWYGKLDEQKLYDYGINHNGEVVSYGSAPEDFATDVLSGVANDFVSSAASDSRPFFVYLAPTAPHTPATPAQRHKGAFAGEEAPRSPSFNEEDVSDKPSWLRDDTESFDDEDISNIDHHYRDRLESMLAVDEMVASLVEELEAAGELDNTYIIFTSDNGYLLGEHRNSDQKDRPYEESARVPLFVRGPGITPETQVDDLVLNNDLVPTFAEFAGVELGEEETDGRSLLPLLQGERPRWRRSAILLEGFVGKGARVYGAVRTKTHKYVEYGNGEAELYDLEADPYELENVYETADPSLIEDLKVRLEALRDCEGDGCREAEDAS